MLPDQRPAKKCWSEKLVSDNVVFSTGTVHVSGKLADDRYLVNLMGQSCGSITKAKVDGLWSSRW